MIGEKVAIGQVLGGHREFLSDDNTEVLVVILLCLIFLQ